MTVDPIHQFEIKRYVDLLNFGGVQFSFTNAALFMFGIVAIIFFFLTYATRGRTLVPGRAQSAAEQADAPSQAPKKRATAVCSALRCLLSRAPSALTSL